MGNAAQESILLLGSEAEIVQDISCSLALIDIPVESVGTVAEASKAARAKGSRLVLSRMQTSEDKEAAVQLAKELGDKSKGDVIPVVLLCTPGEKGLVGNSEELFFGEIDLPVEFPLFTQEVKALLDRLEKQGNEPDNAPAPIARESAVLTVSESEEVSKELPSLLEIEAGEPAATRNLLLAAGIQHEVLKKLGRRDGFEEMQIQEVPGALLEVTKQLCELMSRGKK